MAFGEEYNEATPADNSLFAQGDDAIRQFKRSVAERLASVFNGWPDGPLTLADGLVETATVVDLAITQAKLALLSVGTAQLIDSSVNEAKLVDGSVTKTKIAADAVEDSKIVAVAFSKVTDPHITTAMIDDDAVTFDKIAVDAVGEDQIKDGSITNAKLAPDAIPYTGFMQGKEFAFAVNPLAVYSSHDYNEAFAVPGGLATDYYLFQWDAVGDGDANLEVMVFTKAEAGFVHVYFRDTGADPSVIQGRGFKVLQLRIAA